ncbi:hypothetical protein DFH11DRAFT_1641240 [Phellopilus nigrolimitatus]|nr:hypothetical protein DFH11DRAFT_1641240 [Phellopilus nigrolimitatus]
MPNSSYALLQSVCAQCIEVQRYEQACSLRSVSPLRRRVSRLHGSSRRRRLHLRHTPITRLSPFPRARILNGDKGEIFPTYSRSLLPVQVRTSRRRSRPRRRAMSALYCSPPMNAPGGGRFRSDRRNLRPLSTLDDSTGIRGDATRNFQAPCSSDFGMVWQCDARMHRNGVYGQMKSVLYRMWLSNASICHRYTRYALGLYGRIRMRLGAVPYLTS